MLRIKVRGGVEVGKKWAEYTEYNQRGKNPFRARSKIDFLITLRLCSGQARHSGRLEFPNFVERYQKWGWPARRSYSTFALRNLKYVMSCRELSFDA